MRKFLGLLCSLCLCLAFCATLQSNFTPETASAQTNWESLVDFVVEVEEGRDIRVLQLSDTQIIAGEDTRSSGGGDSMWAYKEVQRHERFVEQVILKYDPDFIFVAGDVIYGRYDDNGEHLIRYIEFMDSFKIPWAPVLGNHDPECYIGIDWVCEQYEKSEYCLFKQRTLTGNGNYSVGLVQGGELKRTFYMLDSNGSGTASQKSLSNGHTKTTAGFGDDQIEWYSESIQKIKNVSPETKFSFAFHIQFYAFVNAYEKYGFTNDKSCLPIDIDNHPDKEEGDFGYMGAVCPTLWDYDNKVYNGLKELGVDSFFVGHEHCNSGSVVYDGIRFQYGQKSSTYDQANYLTANGSIVGSYYDNTGVAIIGGTALPISEEDGSIVNPHIVYYEEGLSLERNFDYNGEDFNTDVSISGISKIATKTTEDIPDGYTGNVYKAESTETIGTGFKFYKNLRINNLSSFKIRVFISDYEKASPTLRIYNDDTSTILTETSFPANYYGKWVEIDILPLLKTSTPLVKNDSLLPFYLVYNCDYISGNTPKMYFDSVKIEYVSTLYQMDKEILPNPLSTFAESSVGQYKTHNYYRYTLSDLGQAEPLHLQGNSNRVFKVGENGYSIIFNLTPTNFKDLNITVLADQSGKNGYCFSFMPNGISLDRPNGHPLDIFEHNIELNETVTLEVGLIRFVYNEQTGAGNGNTACIFAKVNDEMIAMRMLDLCYFEERYYLSIGTFFDENDLLLESLNVVEYRTADGKLLMKDLSSGDISITQEKLNLYSHGIAYTGATVNGQPFTDGQILSNGMHTVTLNLEDEPTDDLYAGALYFDIANAEITLNSSEYDGTEKNIVPIVKDGSTLIQGTDYSLEFYRGENRTTDFISAGEIRVVIKGLNSYTGEVEKIYTISKKSLEITTLAQSSDTLLQDANKISSNGLATGDRISNFTLKRENCQISFENLQITNANGKDVMSNYTITYTYGENHVYGEWTITKEPTETEVGRRERVCTCGKKQIEEVEKLTEKPNDGESNSESEEKTSSQESSSKNEETQSKEETKKGCKGAIGGFPLSIVGLIACHVFKRKREE